MQPDTNTYYYGYSYPNYHNYPGYPVIANQLSNLQNLTDPDPDPESVPEPNPVQTKAVHRKRKGHGSVKKVTWYIPYLSLETIKNNSYLPHLFDKIKREPPVCLPPLPLAKRFLSIHTGYTQLSPIVNVPDPPRATRFTQFKFSMAVPIYKPNPLPRFPYLPSCKLNKYK